MGWESGANLKTIVTLTIITGLLTTRYSRKMRKDNIPFSTTIRSTFQTISLKIFGPLSETYKTVSKWHIYTPSNQPSATTAVTLNTLTQTIDMLHLNNLLALARHPSSKSKETLVKRPYLRPTKIKTREIILKEERRSMWSAAMSHQILSKWKNCSPKVTEFLSEDTV
jgi:hypothetical protein